MRLYHVTDRFSSGNPKNYTCNICGEFPLKWEMDKTDKKRNLAYHLVKKHHDQCYKCNKCDKVFINQLSLADHKRSIHKKNKNIELEITEKGEKTIITFL